MCHIYVAVTSSILFFDIIGKLHSIEGFFFFWCVLNLPKGVLVFDFCRWRIGSGDVFYPDQEHSEVRLGRNIFRFSIRP